MPVSGERRNLELKARDPDPVRSVAACAAVGAVEDGTREQRDTYFEVSSGRLKLREEPEGVAELIAYQRPDDAHSRESRYWRVPVGDPVELQEALASTLGVKVVVSKTRRLYRLDGAQIHLDDVQGLGSFVEFELSAPLDSDLELQRQQLSELRQAFQIDDRDLIAGSYSDLVLLARG